jgi:hypothetical protein
MMTSLPRPVDPARSARAMRGGAAWAVSLVLMCAATLAVGLRAAIILDSVTIRVYDSAGVTAADRSAALKAAARILSRADIDVDWVVCTSAREGTQAACDAPPAPSELVVRLTYSSPTAQDGNRRAFGYSLIDATTGAGTLSTVYVDRVDWLASTGKAPRADVLGRAIAHELGHLMLGSNAHTERGLMRETWTADELARNRSEDWQFSTPQRALLRARWTGSAAMRRAASRDGRPGLSGS